MFRASIVARACAYLMASACVLLGSATSARAGTLTLAWNANTETDIAGYMVNYGTSSGRYSSRVDVGNVTAFTINLTDGTYYFSVQAYNKAGILSAASAEVSGVVQTVLGTTPNPIDFDGDHKSDPMLWRAPTGTWSWVSSVAGYSGLSTRSVQWGNQALGDVALAGDIDGDGEGDLILWRASTGTWYWLTSSTNYAYVSAGAKQWGNRALGDVPMLADVDGDHRADLGVWRASTGTWYWLTSSSGYAYSSAQGRQWGNAALGDRPFAADFDGDGKADFAVWRPSNGTWYWLTSSTNYSYAGARAVQWGNNSAGDVPMVADLDGDHKSDLVVWRASTGTWYWVTSTTGYAASSARSAQWGNQSLGDVPLLADFDGDEKADIGIWRGSTGTWYWLRSMADYAPASPGSKTFGSAAAGDIPIVK